MNAIVQVAFAGGKRVDAQMGDMLIKTDQPKRFGGEETAPAPFQLFLASIATCAGIYAWEYCRKRDIATDGMALEMLCHFDQDKKRYSKMTLALTVPSDFPQQHKEAIARAMDLCAVKKHIIEPPEFEIALRG
jgi:uncharacterized OsmC-like protein